VLINRFLLTPDYEWDEVMSPPALFGCTGMPWVEFTTTTTTTPNDAAVAATTTTTTTAAAADRAVISAADLHIFTVKKIQLLRSLMFLLWQRDYKMLVQFGRQVGLNAFGKTCYHNVDYGSVEVEVSSETLLSVYQITWRHIPEHSNFGFNLYFISNSAAVRRP
jgi:hypothetical protein